MVEHANTVGALSALRSKMYLQGSLNSEGFSTGQDRSMGYSSGFGLIVSPYTTLTDLTAEDEWLVISSDGLYSEEARGVCAGGSSTPFHAADRLAYHDSWLALPPIPGLTRLA